MLEDVTADDVQEKMPLKQQAGVINTSQLLVCLDLASRITGQQFIELFIRCDWCSSIITHCAFPDHDCKVLNLTSD